MGKFVSYLPVDLPSSSTLRWPGEESLPESSGEVSYATTSHRQKAFSAVMFSRHAVERNDAAAVRVGAGLSVEVGSGVIELCAALASGEDENGAPLVTAAFVTTAP